jgi:hypothetical protein
MADMIVVKGRDVQAQVCAELVTRRSFLAYLTVTGEPVPAQLARLNGRAGPATWVSQISAAQYCQWLGRQQGQPFRLPKVSELVEFYSAAAMEGVTENLWPAYAERLPADCVARDACVCEWTQETQEVSMIGFDQGRTLGSIFYPPWLREGANATHIQAHMLATEGYSFVSFRVARDS